MKYKKVLGIDVGGSGIKGAIVKTKSGKLKSERHRIVTPQPATPEAVAEVINQIVQHFKWDGPIGVGFPAAIQHGFVRTAANVDSSWIGVNGNELLFKKTGLPAYLINDADAAGMAEMKFGAGKDHKGTVLLITVGTGIGTVIYSKGKLVPNSELGHIFMSNGKEGEHYASDAARKNEDLSWEDWAVRFNEYVNYLEALFWPDLIIVGGGASKKEKKFFQFLETNATVVTAELLNNAGIVGAALAAKDNRPK